MTDRPNNPPARSAAEEPVEESPLFSKELFSKELISQEAWRQMVDERFQKLNIAHQISQVSTHLTEFAIAKHDWLKAAQLLAGIDARFSAVWVDEYDDYGKVFSLFFVAGHYLLLTTEVKAPELHLPSQATVFPAADRMERHIQDLMGIYFDEHPDGRRWTRHRAWRAKDYPLRFSSPLLPPNMPATPGDNLYPFFQTAGNSVYEIPVGPIHAGIIEPGHFRFQAVGERVLNLEERLGYVHKGIEKRAQGMSAEQLLKLAARVSGDSAVAHSWAAAKAMESVLAIELSEEQQILRGLLCERERIANHIGDTGAICNDVGFAFAHHQCARMRETWQRSNLEIFGHRLLMDTITIGGVSFQLTATQIDTLQQEIANLEKDFEELVSVISDYPSLEDRLATTGRLPPLTAKQLGCLGYVGKGSDFFVDVRLQAPYPPYDQFKPAKVCHHTGDVLSRVQVRIDEVRASLRLSQRLLEHLKEHTASLKSNQAEKATKNPKSGEAIGLIEGWRGETLAFVRLDKDGKVLRYFPRDPSWLNWPALEALIDDNIVADFPVCNKSVNGSYSGVDL